MRFSVKTAGFENLQIKLAEGCARANHAVAEEIRSDTAPYVPALTGSLDTRTRVVDNMVIYPGPYAQFLYYGKVMVDPETGSTYAPKDGIKVVTDKNLVFNKSEHAQAQAFWFEASKAENLEKWIRTAEKAVKHEYG